METGEDGTMHRKIRFVARSQGTTDLVFTRRRLHVVKFGEPPPKPEQTSITIRVVK